MKAAPLLVLAAALCCCGCARKTDPWTALEIPTDADFVGAWFADSLNGWISGGGWDIDGGIVGRTRDGGRSWQFQSGVVHGGGDGASVGRVQFRDSLQGWVVGGYGDVLLTSNGGETWRPARNDGTGVPLSQVQFVDARNGWAVGSGSLMRSDDGGETWRQLRGPGPDYRRWSGFAIHFVDDQRGWLVGEGGSVMRTDDGGENWTPVTLPLRAGERPALRDVWFLDGRRGWIVGEKGSIFHTEDGGLNWSLQEHGVPIVRPIPKGEPRRHEIVPELEVEPERLALFRVCFADAKRGWAVGYYSDVAESVVLGTHDGGATWVVEHVQRGELLRTLFVLDANHAWAAGDRARTVPQVVLRYAPRGS